jgi:hypothetical protein
MTTIKFWNGPARPDHTNEHTVATTKCPTMRCLHDADPIKKITQDRTAQAAIIWGCPAGHKFFACEVQNFLPRRDMRIKGKGF